MNSPRWTLVLLSIAAVCWIHVPTAFSQNLTDQWVEKSARPFVENRLVTGLSVGYIDGTRHGIMHLGSSNRVGKQPDDSTVYEIGSISKLFTSLLLADAVVRGRIDLDATADVPNAAGIHFPSREGRSIKWIDLSTHRSGLPSAPDNLVVANILDPWHDYDSKQAAAFLKDYKLPRAPGASYEYSNIGVATLGYLLTQKAGKSYQQLLRERIAEPLQLTDCTTELSEDQRQRLATPHDPFGRATPPWTFADLPGDGGICATIRDMMSFAQAQLTPPPGKLGEAIELAWKQQSAVDATSRFAMGLGWHILPDGQTRWHNGETGGFSSAIVVNRQSNCEVVVLCNTARITAGRDEIDQLAMQLQQKAEGKEPEPAPTEISDEEAGALAIDANLRRRLEGRYQVAPGTIFTVRDRDGHLMIDVTGLPALKATAESPEVFPQTPTRWTFRGIDATLEFKLPKTGPATRLVLHENQTAYRLKDGTKSDVPDIDAKLRQRLEGRYQLAPDFIITVRDRDGHLMVGATNQPAQEVFPDSPTRWSYWGIDATIQFKLDKSGPAPSLVLRQNGIDQTAQRIDPDSKPKLAEAADQKTGNLTIDAKLRHRLEGRYKLAPNFIFTVEDNNGHLMVGITNQPTQEVFPDSPTLWSYHGIDAKLEFKLDKSGPAPSLVLHQNGADQTAQRIDQNSKPKPAEAADQKTVTPVIDAKFRHRLEGRYKLAPNFIFTVEDDNGHLMVGITNQATQEVFPDSPTRWSYRGVDATLEFKLKKTGPATSLVLLQNGKRLTARRMK